MEKSDAAAPPPVDSSALSQRMLIMMTEKLVKEDKKISHQEKVRRSGEIGDMENRIKNRVHEILYEVEAAPEGADAAPDQVVIYDPGRFSSVVEQPPCQR